MRRRRSRRAKGVRRSKLQERKEKERKRKAWVLVIVMGGMGSMSKVTGLPTVSLFPPLSSGRLQKH